MRTTMTTVTATVMVEAAAGMVTKLLVRRLMHMATAMAATLM